MDLLTGGLVLGTGLASFEFIVFLRDKLYRQNKIVNTWYTLMENQKLSGYSLVSSEDIDSGIRLIIKIAIGGTVSELEKRQEHMEKAFKAKVKVENIDYSDQCIIDIKYKQ